MYRRSEFPITRSQRVSRTKVQLAKNLRRKMTPAESLLWTELRGGRLGGFHFRRQQVIVGFIADFYCVAAKLAVEIDRPIHRTQTETDRYRDEAFAAVGLLTLRFRNEEVAGDIELVLQRILSACQVRT